MMVACINEIIITNYLIIIANAATSRRLAVTIVSRGWKKRKKKRNARNTITIAKGTLYS